MLSIKIHHAYRTVVALCDKDLLNKTFKEKNMKIHVNERFFKGNDINEEDAERILKSENNKDATFNIVGENSVKTALKAGIITKDSIIKIQKVPIALVLL